MTKHPKSQASAQKNIKANRPSDIKAQRGKLDWKRKIEKKNNSSNDLARGGDEDAGKKRHLGVKQDGHCLGPRAPNSFKQPGRKRGICKEELTD